jgi:membrane-bound lytic murein transglycosylase A
MGSRPRYIWLVVFISGLIALALLFFCRQYQASVRTSVHLEIVPQKSWPELCTDSDDFDLNSLRQALKRNLIYLKKLPGAREFAYGSVMVKAEKVLAVQQELLDFLEQEEEPAVPALVQFLKSKFNLLESVAVGYLPWLRDENPVLFTGYYVPTLHGSLTAKAKYRFPLYRKPDDLVTVDLPKFNLRRRVRKLWPWLAGLPFGPRLRELHFPQLRGRFLANGKVVPYYTRADIDYANKLQGKNLELLWVDDEIDRFFLQIQGSGLVRLEDGTSVMVGYNAANGQPYRSIGGWLIRQGLMTRAEVSMPSIRAWLKNHPERIKEVFKVNPSYVFFRELKTPAALGCYQVPLTANRSIATDRKMFPGGALALVATERPIFSPTGRLTAWRRYQRLVFNQDTGGAIKGPYRVDLYCGEDKAAECMAGVMKQHGRLFFFVPR